MDGFRSLREGEEVEYDIEVGPDGRSKAINVTGPSGAAPLVRRGRRRWGARAGGTRALAGAARPAAGAAQ